MNPFKLPPKLLLGSCTSATQIEGGDKNNTWYRWCLEGHIEDGSTSLRGADHWNRVEEDIQLLKKLNQKIYRMGIEWSRIEPQKGHFDASAMEHYVQELKLLKQHGICPLVTLHHFSEPLWFADSGGFEKKDAAEVFERYVRYVVESLGDLACEYITFNEPNVYVTNGYHFGTWPPGKKNLMVAIGVFKVITHSHILAYKAIHEIRKKRGYQGDTKVGIAHHLRVFEPFSKGILDKIATWAMAYLFQDLIVKAMSTGILSLPMGLGSPWGKGRFYDFMGINYYSRSAVHFKGFKDDFFPNVPKCDLGWEIYPEGLSKVCSMIYAKYQAPIWITENGTCDHEDRFRSKFIYDHLWEISKLSDKNIPVERYYHWALMDNFEWLEGESAPFGLIEVDFETQKRTIRCSGEFYGAVCRSHEVDEEMMETYFQGDNEQAYKIQ